MKIVTLVENSCSRADLTPEHGFSLYVETGEHVLLIDMGQSDAFARNAEALGIDLSCVELAILSHGHYDHGGGLETFFHLNQTAQVYIHETAFGDYYNGMQKYIGLDNSLRTSPRLSYVRGKQELCQDIFLTDGNDHSWQIDSFGLTQKEVEQFRPDSFEHEQYLLIKEGQTLYLFSGCSHKGILNIVRAYRPDVVIGGFHLNKIQDEEILRQIAKELLELGAAYYTGHCTGQKQFSVMKQILGDRLQSLTTGMQILFEKT